MTRRRRAPPPPAHMLEPGYFTALMRAHDWPPGFVSRIDDEAADHRARLLGAAAMAHRERQAKDGIGWGTGTTVMPGTPKNKRPMWMLRTPGE